MFGDNATDDAERAGFSRRRHARFRGDARRARARSGAPPRRARRPRRWRAGGRRSLRYSGFKAAQKLVDYATKHYSSVDNNDIKMLRRRLIEAGIYDPHGAAYFFIARVALGARARRGCVFPGCRCSASPARRSFWLFVVCGGVLGYLVPSLYLDRRIAARRLEHQVGLSRFHGSAWWSAPMPG